jgi:dienelactone hydrolase
MSDADEAGASAAGSDEAGASAAGSDEAGASATPADGGSPVGDRRLVVLALAGLALVVAGTAVGHTVTTAGGDVELRGTTFRTDDGTRLAATVYEPADASAADPAPGVVLFHGYSGDRGTMNGFAIEFARRGYVAVTVDAPGHGDSGGAVGDDRVGGPAALAAVRSMPAVDEDRVAVAGHSMGGFASLEAAAAHPDGHAAVVLVSSSWDDDDRVNETVPRNLAVVFGRYDELSATWWDEPAPGRARRSAKLAAAFGTAPPVERGRVYGNVSAGTGRTLTAPPTVHVGMFRSTQAVGDTVEWVALATGGPADPPPRAQVWYWAVLGHGVALVGGLLAAVAVAALAWRRLEGLDGEGGAEADAVDSATVSSPSDEGVPRRTLLALSALPAVTVYPLYGVGAALVPVTVVTAQVPTNGTSVWAVGTLLVGAGVVRWRHGGVDRVTLWRLVPGRRAVAAAVAGAGALSVLAAAVDAVPGGALRSVLFGVGPLAPHRWLSTASYGVVLVPAAVALSVGLARLLPRAPTARRDLARAVGLTCGGLVTFAAVQYVPLLAGFGLPVEVGLLSTIAVFATVYVGLATVVARACHRLTGSAHLGGLLAGLVVTLSVAGSGPLHVPPL